ncbi:hypothetical protein [Bacillus sp. NPDC094106]|uniref:hypothetical protein n=1 Tax=Bacillus sp. NPDC094106 TaxID=3363949 RepID=UPI00380B6052
MNRRVKIITLCAMVLSSSIVMSGCTYYKIPFKSFVKEIKPEEKEKKIPKIAGLKIEDIQNELDSLDSMDNQLKTIESIIKEKDSYLKAMSNGKSMYKLLHSVFTNNYESNEDAFFETLADMYKKEHRKVDSITLTAFGKQMIDNNEKYKAIIDINSVDDDKTFDIQTIELILNDKLKIEKSNKVGSIHESEHTESPLMGESTMESNVHNEFLLELNTFLHSMDSKGLHQQVVNEEVKENSPEFAELAKKMGLSEKSASALYQLSKFTKQEMNKKAITGYLHDDKNVRAVTVYTLSVPTEKGIHHFKIDFKRGMNKIISIKESNPS